MAILTFEQLKYAAAVYTQEWTSLTVKDETMTPADSAGSIWVSFWDNWLLPTASPVPPGSLDPLVVVNGIAISNSADCTITGGDSIRGRITLNTPVGPDSIVLASFRRSLFRDTFWRNNLFQATNNIGNRLFSSTTLVYTNLDDVNDPWGIIVKQAGLNAIMNLQTMLVGFGDTQMEGMRVNLQRAASMIADTLNQLCDEVDRDVVAYRWARSPMGRAVTRRPLPGPFPLTAWGS